MSIYYKTIAPHPHDADHDTADNISRMKEAVAAEVQLLIGKFSSFQANYNLFLESPSYLTASLEYIK